MLDIFNFLHSQVPSTTTHCTIESGGGNGNNLGKGVKVKRSINTLTQCYQDDPVGSSVGQKLSFYSLQGIGT